MTFEVLACLNDTHLDAQSLVRLYCISGNDFNHSLNVSTTDHLIRTYLRWNKLIRKLETCLCVLSLFYMAFLGAAKIDGEMTSELKAFDFMSREWKERVRENICCGPPVKTTFHLLPQDNDLELVYRRSVLFNVELYWVRCVQPEHIKIPYNVNERYKDDGKILLPRNADIASRASILKRLNSKCNCGSIKHTNCCATMQCSCGKD